MRAVHRLTDVMEVEMSKRLVALFTVFALSALPAVAEDAKIRPEDGRKPSEILSAVEGRPDFTRLHEMSWNDRGYYEIEYRTKDKARVEINIDAKSGQPVEQE
jgi:hypothetical protein